MINPLSYLPEGPRFDWELKNKIVPGGLKELEMWLYCSALKQGIKIPWIISVNLSGSTFFPWPFSLVGLIIQTKKVRKSRRTGSVPHGYSSVFAPPSMTSWCFQINLVNLHLALSYNDNIVAHKTDCKQPCTLTRLSEHSEQNCVQYFFWNSVLNISFIADSQDDSK